MIESEGSQPAKPPKADKRSFLERFPWEKMTIWGLFLLLVYALRSFFLLIFLTFIFSYMMVNLVRAAHRVISPNRDKLWLHRTLTVASFGLLIASLYGVIVFLEAPFRAQINAVWSRTQNIDLKNLGGKILSNTIGELQYERLYAGKDGQARRKADLEAFKKRPRELIREFDRSWRELEDGFRKWFRQRYGRQRREELEGSDALTEHLRRYIEQKRAPEIYKDDKAVWDEKWQRNYVEMHGRTRAENFSEGLSLEELQEDAVEFERQRTAWILAEITGQELLNSETYLYAPDFYSYLADQYYAERSKDELQDELEIYYTGPEYYAADPIPRQYRFSYSFDKLIRLRDSREDPQAFRRAFQDELGPEEQDEKIEELFKRYTTEKLAREAFAGWDFISLESINEDITNKYIPQIGKGVWGGGFALFGWLVQFLLSLLLSFFITMDIHRMKKGLELLHRSRARNFYEEISPSLAAFGRLMGRAFQAQGVIALCNTLLTFALIKLLGIPNETFLCAIVFICSFIPVLGVVLSTVPVALVALIYVDAWTMVLSVLGVLAIHFIETSILNPKILGEMMHLHPVLVLCILAVGERFFHVWGLLLGVPVAVYIIRYVILGEDIESLTEAPHSTEKSPVKRPEAPDADGEARADSAELAAALPEPEIGPVSVARAREAAESLQEAAPRSPSRDS